MVFPGKTFDAIQIGDSFTSAMTITETHLVLGAGLIGDFNPLHINEQFASQSRFGGRILHGVLTGAIIGAPIGAIFSGTAIAYLEQSCRFKCPVKPGDTLTIIWTAAEKIDKPKANGGIVVMTAVCRNQRDEVVAEADGKVLVANAT